MTHFWREDVTLISTNLDIVLAVHSRCEPTFLEKKNPSCAYTISRLPLSWCQHINKPTASNKREGHSPKATISSTLANVTYNKLNNNLSTSTGKIYSVTIQEVQTKMIVIASGVHETDANAACRSLDTQVNQLRQEGKLKPGEDTLKFLEWTDETKLVARTFKQSVDLTPLAAFGVTVTRDNIKSKRPMVYLDVPSIPHRYDKSGPTKGVLGILALGTVVLPEYGNSGRNEIRSGWVAYFRESDPVVYRECEGGRAILFHIPYG